MKLTCNSHPSLCLDRLKWKCWQRRDFVLGVPREEGEGVCPLLGRQGGLRGFLAFREAEAGSLSPGITGDELVVGRRELQAQSSLEEAQLASTPG